MDSDIILKDKKVFNYLVAPIVNYERVGIVCSYHVANEQPTFIGRLAYFGFKIWDNARTKLGSRGIRYYSEGGLRAFSNEFTKALILPENCALSEDSYSFYFAIDNGFKVKAIRKAKAYVDLPETYKDYSKQMKRFLTALGGVENTFDSSLIRRFQLITPKLKLYALIEEFLKDPLVGFCYIILQGLIYIELPFYKPKIIWTSIERKQYEKKY
jgi:cellulose synthase/poly-beta-1,6-N-acetylglucosamine synthase-like glycosyltransferase